MLPVLFADLDACPSFVHAETEFMCSHSAVGTDLTAVYLQERETQLGDRPFRLLERSVFSDRMVFVRAVHQARWMSDLELNIYDSW